MSNLSDPTEVIMATAVADTATPETDTVTEGAPEADKAETPADTDAEGDSSKAEEKAEEKDVFRLDANDVPFKNLVAARESGPETYKILLQAFSAVWGKDVEVIESGFNTTIKCEKAKAEIVTFDKELAGYTPGNSLIKLLQVGTGIATDGGGNVSFNIVLVPGEEKDGVVAADTAVITSVWRGIDGMSSRRGGSGGGKGRYQYFDDGTAIEGSLKKYLLDKRGNSHAATRIRKNDADLAAGGKGRLSAFEAAKDGKKDGDSFTITRSEKKKTADSSS